MTSDDRSEKKTKGDRGGVLGASRDDYRDREQKRRQRRRWGVCSRGGVLVASHGDGGWGGERNNESEVEGVLCLVPRAGVKKGMYMSGCVMVMESESFLRASRR